MLLLNINYYIKYDFFNKITFFKSNKINFLKTWLVKVINKPKSAKKLNNPLKPRLFASPLSKKCLKTEESKSVGIIK